MSLRDAGPSGNLNTGASMASRASSVAWRASAVGILRNVDTERGHKTAELLLATGSEFSSACVGGLDTTSRLPVVDDDGDDQDELIDSGNDRLGTKGGPGAPNPRVGDANGGNDQTVDPIIRGAALAERRPTLSSSVAGLSSVPWRL